MRTIQVLSVILVFTSALPQNKRFGFRNVSKGLNIIGGDEVEPHSIPFQAFLEVYADIGGWYCGGSLISKNYVMTSATCCFEAIEVEVILGAHKPFENEDSQIRFISSHMKIHENYDRNSLKNDIALIKLPESVDQTNAIQNVILPKLVDEFVGEMVRITGWGLTTSIGYKPSEVLNSVNVTIMSNSDCEKYFEDGVIHDTNICTSGDSGRGSCLGDTGGPLTANGVQIGIVSFNIRSCLSGYPSAFTRISSYLEWIKLNSDVTI